MNWVRSKQLLWWVLVVALLANIPAIAAMMEGESELESMDKPTRESKEMAQEKMMQRPGQVAPLHSADEMIGHDVETSAGEEIGEIENLLVDTYNNKVCYVVISAEGKQYPIPRSAFKMQKEKDVCVLNINKDQLMKGPSYDSIEPSDLDKAEWETRIMDHYRDMIPKETTTPQGAARQMGYEGEEKMTAAKAHPGRYVLISKIIGLNVKDAAEKDLGEIKDALIDSKGGYLAYALVSYGGVAGIADKTAAVPWSAIEIQRDLDYAMLDADRSALEMATVTDADIERLNQPTYARRFYEQFGQEPYWEVFGYVPAMEMGSWTAWQPESAYNTKFNPQAMQTVEGTITNVGTFMPEKGSTAGLKLKVESRDGQTMTVHVGPRRWVTQQDAKLTAGSDVTIKGSKVQIGERSVILASEVTSEGKTIKLRDDQGKPLWKAEGMKPKIQPESMPQRRPEQSPSY